MVTLLPLVAQVPSEASVTGYAIISLLYLGLCFCTYFIVNAPDGRLLGLGILTITAAMGYGTVVASPGIVMAPIMLKVGVLLVLAGIVTRLFVSAACREEPSGDLFDRPSSEQSASNLGE